MDGDVCVCVRWIEMNGLAMWFVCVECVCVVMDVCVCVCVGGGGGDGCVDGWFGEGWL
jgi:hypothetical protein